MTAAPTISFDNVSKNYGEGRVLDRVTLAVPERQFLAVVGPSGSGKSTLLRLVNRLIDPSAGTVRVEGEDVQGTDAVGEAALGFARTGGGFALAVDGARRADVGQIAGQHRLDR